MHAVLYPLTHKNRLHSTSFTDVSLSLAVITLRPPCFVTLVKKKRHTKTKLSANLLSALILVFPTQNKACAYEMQDIYNLETAAELFCEGLSRGSDRNNI